jgi:hypothetical protein
MPGETMTNRTKGVRRREIHIPLRSVFALNSWQSVGEALEEFFDVTVLAVTFMVARDDLIGKVNAQLALNHVAEFLLYPGLVRQVAKCQIQLRPKARDGVQYLPGAVVDADISPGR